MFKIKLAINKTTFIEALAPLYPLMPKFESF